LAGLPDEIYNKIEILDNTNITKITENLKRYELAKTVRKTDEKQNSNVDKLNEEINILKKHIQQLTTDIRKNRYKIIHHIIAMELITIAKFMINNLQINIFHHILIRTNKTLDLHTIKLVKIHQNTFTQQQNQY